jgi:hypothetical protein
MKGRGSTGSASDTRYSCHFTPNLQATSFKLFNNMSAHVFLQRLMCNTNTGLRLVCVTFVSPPCPALRVSFADTLFE